jgi:pilus assembly protein CpaF
LLNAQLPDGSRLAAVIPPVVRDTPAMVIRKFTSRRYTVEDLIARGTLSRPLAEFLAAQIEDGKTILISGGTPLPMEPETTQGNLIFPDDVVQAPGHVME